MQHLQTLQACMQPTRRSQECMCLQATNWDEEVACSMIVVDVSLKRAAMRVCSSPSTALVLPCKPHNALLRDRDRQLFCDPTATQKTKKYT